MATITIPDTIFAELSDKAQKMGITVEQLVLPLLEKSVPVVPTPEERRRAFKEWQELVEKRADRYPPGFQVDDSRETIYFGREDTQQ
jgi:hypothetical protein